MKKNIIFVMPSLGNGGAERSLVNLLRLLDYNKYNVDLLLFKKQGLRLNDVPKKVNIISDFSCLHELYGKKTNNVFLNVYYLIYRIIASLVSRIVCNNNIESKQFRWNHFYSKKVKSLEKKYDVAIAYISGETSYYVADKIDARNKICWVHNDYSKMGINDKILNFDKEYFKKFNHIVTISDICGDILKDMMNDKEITKKIKIIPNLTASENVIKKSNEFYPEEYKDFNGLILLSVGRLDAQKRFDRAILTAKLLKESNYAFKWFILGRGKEYHKLSNMIIKNKLESNMFLLGVRANPYPYIKNASIIVQTSDFEGKSMVLDEAKILNKLIVSTDYNSVCDQIEHNKTGIIVEKNSDSIFNGIVNLEGNNYLKTSILNELRNKSWSNENEIIKYYKMFDE